MTINNGGESLGSTLLLEWERVSWRCFLGSIPAVNFDSHLEFIEGEGYNQL
jgi:hypothetical protein